MRYHENCILVSYRAPWSSHVCPWGIISEISAGLSSLLVSWHIKVYTLFEFGMLQGQKGFEFAIEAGGKTKLTQKSRYAKIYMYIFFIHFGSLQGNLSLDGLVGLYVL
jgi:hypothetical protein